MDENEANGAVEPADIAASDGVHDLASTAVTAGKTQTADSVVDGMSEAARFLREKATSALATEEARAETMAELRDIAHAALAALAGDASSNLDAYATKDETNEANLPPLIHEERTILSEKTEEGPQPQLGGFYHSKRGAVSDDEMRTAHAGPFFNTAPVPSTTGTRNSSVGSDTVLDGQSATAGMDLPSFSKDVCGGQTQAGGGADSVGTEKTRSVGIEKDVLRPTETSSYRRKLPEHKASPTEHRVAAAFLASVYLAVLGSEAPEAHATTGIAGQHVAGGTFPINSAESWTVQTEQSGNETLVNRSAEAVDNTAEGGTDSGFGRGISTVGSLETGSVDTPRTIASLETAMATGSSVRPSAVSSSMPQASLSRSTALTAPAGVGAGVSYALGGGIHASSTCERCAATDYLAQKYASLVVDEMAALADLAGSTDQAPAEGAIQREKADPGRAKPKQEVSHSALGGGGGLDDDTDRGTCGGSMDTDLTVTPSGASAPEQAAGTSTKPQASSTCSTSQTAPVETGAGGAFALDEDIQAFHICVLNCVAADYLAQEHMSLVVAEMATSSNIWGSTSPAPTGGTSQCTKTGPVRLQLEREISKSPERGDRAVDGNSDGSNGTRSFDTALTVTSFDGIAPALSTVGSSTPQVPSGCATSLAAPVEAGTGAGFTLDEASPTSVGSCVAIDYLAQAYASLVALEMAAPADVEGCMNEAPTGGTVLSENLEPVRVQSGKEDPESPEKSDRAVDDDVNRSIIGGSLDAGPANASSETSASASSATGSSILQVSSTCNTSLTAPVAAGAGVGYAVEEHAKSSLASIRRCIAADCLAEVYAVLVPARVAALADIGGSTNQALTGRTSEREKVESRREQPDQEFLQAAEGSDGVVDADNGGNIIGDSLNTGHTMTPSGTIALAPPAVCSSMPQVSSTCNTLLTAPVAGTADSGFALVKATQDSPTYVGSCVVADFLAQEYASLAASELAAQSDLVGSTSQAPTRGALLSEKIEPGRLKSELEISDTAERCGAVVDNDNDNDGNNVGGYLDTGRTVASSDAGASTAFAMPAASAVGSRMPQVLSTCNTALKTSVVAGARVEYAVDEGAQASPASLGSYVAADYLAQVYVSLAVSLPSGGGISTLSLVAAAGRDSNASAWTSSVDGQKTAGTAINSVEASANLVTSVTLQHRSDVGGDESLSNDATRVASTADLRDPNDTCVVDDSLERGLGSLMKAEVGTTQSPRKKSFTTDTAACPGDDLPSLRVIPAALEKDDTADPTLAFAGCTALMTVQDANFVRNNDEGGASPDRSGGARIDATRLSLIVVEAWKLIDYVTLSSLAKATAVLEAMARDQACKRGLLTPVYHLDDGNVPPEVAVSLRLEEPSQSSSTELWAARDNTQSTRVASPPEPVESPLQAAFVEDNVRQDREGSENEVGHVPSEFTPCLPVSVETRTARQASTTIATGQTRDGYEMPDDVARPSPVSAQAFVPLASQDSKMTTQSASKLNEHAGDATREQRPEGDRYEMECLPSPPLQAAVVATYLSGAYGRALAAAGAPTLCAGIRRMSPDTLSIGDEEVCVSVTDTIGNQRGLASLLPRDDPKTCVAARTLESRENETSTPRMPLEHQTIENLANFQVVEADNVSGSSVARPCELLISPGVEEDQVPTSQFRHATPAASSTETVAPRGSSDCDIVRPDGSVLESTVEKTEPVPCPNKGEQRLREESGGFAAQIQRADAQNMAQESCGDLSPTFPPTPPATPNAEKYGGVNLNVKPDFQSKSGDGRPPHPTEEALRWLQAAGARAKSMHPNVARSPMEIAEGLHETGEREKSPPDGGTRIRVDAVAWLQQARTRAKSQQGRADGVHVMLEPGRKRGEPRVEAAEWLQTVGDRAKSQQDDAARIRSKAAAWLNTRGGTELQQAQSLERSTAESCGKLDGDVFGQHVSSESIKESNTESPTKIEDVINSDESYLPYEDKSAAQRKGNGRSTALLAAVEADGSTRSIKGNVPPFAEEQINARDTNPSAPKRSSQTASVLALGIANVGQPADRPPSADRTAPAPWLEPASTPLPRGGSVAPTEPAEEDLSRVLDVGEMESTEAGPGGMLEVGEKEWARVSLSRTPPFDALNSPSPAVRWPPAGGRLRAFPPGVDGLDSSAIPSTISSKAGDVGGLTQTGVAAAAGGGGASGCVIMPAANAGGAGWVEFFAPAHRMAPTGDAYGIDSFRSSGASASTTVRGDSTGSFMPPDTSYVADEEQPTRRRDNQEWRWSNAEESRTLCEVQNPVAEAQRRITDRQQHLSYKQGGRGSSEEEPEQSVTSSGRVISSRRRWNKAAERSRQYTREWETFLSQAHLYFDGEAELRKRLSVIRRAHPAVSNEIAFIALAQSRGRASEAAAVLHLARAKDEASLIAMMLDVTSFIAFAREAAERQRRLRQLEGQRKTYHSTAQSKPGPSCPDLQQREETRQPPIARCKLKSSEQHGQEGPFIPDEAGAPSSSDEGLGSGGVAGGWSEARRAPNRARRGCRAERLAASQDGEGRSELQSRGPGSAPALLPPLVGLTVGTPPTPKTLKTVLSTSTSMALEIPKKFGLIPEVGGDAKRVTVIGRSASDTRRAQSGVRPEHYAERFQLFIPNNFVADARNRREHKASLRARARRQRKRLAEMSAPGGCSENSGTSLDALTDRFIHETCTLARDSRHVDARVRRRQRGLAGRGGGGKGAGGNGSNNNSLTGSASLSLGQGSSVFLESFPDVTAESQEQGRGEEGLSNRASPAISPESGGGDRRSCRVQSYFTQATRCSLEAVGLREER